MQKLCTYQTHGLELNEVVGPFSNALETPPGRFECLVYAAIEDILEICPNASRALKGFARCLVDGCFALAGWEIGECVQRNHADFDSAHVWDVHPFVVHEDMALFTTHAILLTMLGVEGGVFRVHTASHDPALLDREKEPRARMDVVLGPHPVCLEDGRRRDAVLQHDGGEGVAPGDGMDVDHALGGSEIVAQGLCTAVLGRIHFPALQPGGGVVVGGGMGGMAGRETFALLQL